MTFTKAMTAVAVVWATSMGMAAVNDVQAQSSSATMATRGADVTRSAIGKDIFSANGDKVGTVQDIVRSSADAAGESFVVVSTADGRQVAIPTGEVAMDNSGRAVLTSPVTPDSLGDMPAYDGAGYTPTDDTQDNQDQGNRSASTPGTGTGNAGAAGSGDASDGTSGSTSDAGSGDSSGSGSGGSSGG